MKESRAVIQNLLNRLQSEDLRTFHSLQSTSFEIPEGPFYPRTDEGEIEQLKDLGNTSGIGEAIYDDEFNATVADFGIDFPDGAVPRDEIPE